MEKKNGMYKGTRHPEEFLVIGVGASYMKTLKGLLWQDYYCEV